MRPLRIVRMRRDYNRWAADQSLEDYALRFTARSARAATPLRAALTALGSISFLALEAIGGTLTMAFGFSNTALAILFVSAVIFLVSLPICATAARSGLDIDLLTRGTGFGYIGSTLTSLIYASFTFIFFGIEAAILAALLEQIPGVSHTIACCLAALLVIPLVTGGFRFIARFQIFSLPIWFALNLIPLIAILYAHPDWIGDWVQFRGLASTQPVNIFAIGSAASIMFVLICQSAEQVDFLRFMPPLSRTNRLRWWCALIAGGPGWIVFDAAKLFAGSFLAWAVLHAGFSPERAVQPQQMYRLAYGTFLSPVFATLATAALVIVAQFKINITNAYAGSLAWSNFFSRLTHSHPGRVFYVLFTVALALLLMLAGLVNTIETGIVLYADLAAAWVGPILADIVLCKPLRLSPPFVEFKRALLPDINPVGLGAALTGAVTGVLCTDGYFGPYASAFSPFIALGLSFLVTPFLAALTGGRTYLARRAPADWNTRGSMKCVICEHTFEATDMARCPAYGGTICSLCCSLDARCNDRCKPTVTHLRQQFSLPFELFPVKMKAFLLSTKGRFLLFAGLGTAAILLIGDTSFAHNHTYLVLFFLVVLTSWLVVLGQDGRQAAGEETRRQTLLLMNEIRAHQRTDAALKRAREKAESASLAKTRYLSGISHEIRAPLNTIMGYTQILQNDHRMPTDRQDVLRTIRESGEHMTGLLTGLLDISKIEAGRIELYSDRIALGQFLNTVVQMVRPQARAKRLDFHYHPGYLPPVVMGDEHRLRQILLNLLSNAVKFTPSGSVTFTANWRGQIAEFIIEDTGPGIAPADQERIFEPFERAAGDAVPGTGLGLTITRLLTHILGGELTLTSEIGHGTRFRVRLLLSDRAEDAAPTLHGLPSGYEGACKTILVVDDNAAHRRMMHEFLGSRHFNIRDVSSGAECLEFLKTELPDLIILDLSMPGMDGRELALRIRETSAGHLPLLFLTGNVTELASRRVPSLDDCTVLPKPVDFQALLDEIGRLLDIKWIFQSENDALSEETFLTLTSDEVTAQSPGDTQPPLSADTPLAANEKMELTELINSGNVRLLRQKLDLLCNSHPHLAMTLAPVQEAARTYQLETVRRLLEELPA
ncbi:hybrid sensor histidine kinase/response regulator [Acetobacter sicerae]|uniref:hybrid sensor histidine kinase/response regulator n=1 Tax=Acetobacter sicerae TaxID=85325 RepID=UPI00156B7075|nr:ATP-binding protein [Acetobacter sicerae]NHN91144.1 response regulator [Acetobacter sicerae]